MRAALRAHWPEYLIEAFALGTFMLAACLATVLLEHPDARLHAALPDANVRRALLGVAMGLTAVALVYSPWGRRSGAHMNPALTLAFLRLGRVAPWDAAGYVVAQVAGGVAGVLLAAALAGSRVAHPAVRWAVTVPGPRGAAVAFVAEAAISFVLLAVVLAMNGDPRRARWTGVCCGVLVAGCIAVEAPLSGMSMNPARSLASALPAGTWTDFWVYLIAPPLGMLLAAERHLRRGRRVPCAKLRHDVGRPCQFGCDAVAAPGVARAA